MTNKVYLHIGCGSRRITGKGWINVDRRPEVRPDLVSDAICLEALDNESVDLVYACHILEHFRPPRAIMALEEWARVLKPRCPLWIAVPDIGNISKAIVSGASLRRLKGLIWGGQTYSENFHYTGWDFESLCEDMRVAGFYNIVRLPLPLIPIKDFSEGIIELENGTILATSLNLKGLKVPV